MEVDVEASAGCFARHVQVSLVSWLGWLGAVRALSSFPRYLHGYSPSGHGDFAG